MENCIFCKIINKEIPSYTVYEDSNVLAFLDINPHAKGHAVVVPKVHAETVQDMNEEILKDLAPAVRQVMGMLQSKLQPDGFNVGLNDGAAAGQVVPHVHIHIMPRYEGDGGGSMHSIVNNKGGASVEDIYKLFK